MMLANILSVFSDVTLDISAIVVALAALGGLHIVRRQFTRTETQSNENKHVIERREHVDASVLDKFTDLYERIGGLEERLARATDRITDMEKQAETLQARLHEKDKEIIALKAALTKARNRIVDLEDMCEELGHPIPRQHKGG
jgi:chromosome segregation ATPase